MDSVARGDLNTLLGSLISGESFEPELRVPGERLAVSEATGELRRIGDLVYVRMRITASGSDGKSGHLRMQMPNNVPSLPQSKIISTVPTIYGVTGVTDYMGFYAEQSMGRRDSLYLYRITNSGSLATFTTDSLTSSTVMEISMMYTSSETT